MPAASPNKQLQYPIHCENKRQNTGQGIHDTGFQSCFFMSLEKSFNLLSLRRWTSSFQILAYNSNIIMLNPIKKEWMNTCINKRINDEGPCCHLVAQSCPTFYDPMDCSPPGSSVHGFSRQEYWSGLLFPSPGDLPHPRTESQSLVLAGRFFTI